MEGSGDEPVKGPQVIASAFIERDGRFLMLLCPRFRVWRVPGGRVEFDESVTDTLKREMREEIGIDIKDPRFLGYGQDHQFHFRKQKGTSRLLMFFHARIDKEPVIDPDEADESKWVTLDEMKGMDKKEGGLTDFFSKNPGLKL